MRRHPLFSAHEVGYKIPLMRIVGLLGAVAVLFGLVAVAAAQDYRALDVRDAWVDPAPKGGTTRLHAVLVNTASTTLVIESLTTPTAARVWVGRLTATPTGLVRQDLLDTLQIPPHGTLLVTPDVTDVRLADLTRDLDEGDEIPLFIRTPDGQRTVRIPVGAPRSPRLEPASKDLLP